MDITDETMKHMYEWFAWSNLDVTESLLDGQKIPGFTTEQMIQYMIANQPKFGELQVGNTIDEKAVFMPGYGIGEGSFPGSDGVSEKLKNVKMVAIVNQQTVSSGEGLARAVFCFVFSFLFSISNFQHSLSTHTFQLKIIQKIPNHKKKGRLARRRLWARYRAATIFWVLWHDARKLCGVWCVYAGGI